VANRDGNYDASEEFESNASHNTQSLSIGNTTVSNTESPITPNQSPCRRSRDQMDDNEEFRSATMKNKKHRQDSTAENQPSPQRQEQQYTPRHRYPTRLQYYQQGQDVGRRDDHDAHNWPANQHTSQTVSSTINVTTAATRYATTRFPFAPFVVRFSTNTIPETQIAKDLVKHSDQQHQLILHISNVRKSTLKCLPNECDYLIYVKTASSFAWLYGKQNWPTSLGGHSFTFPSMPSFPPQLSLVLKNVDLRTDVDDLAVCLKSSHPEIFNVIRLRNKFQNEIKMIKLEILSINTRLTLLNDRKVRVNGMTYDVEEYLSPATVLICSQCRGIGHFKSQCTQIEQTCNICGVTCTDLRNHTCSNAMKCIHCSGEHTSNSMKCPVIKDYRAALTKKLLGTDSSRRMQSQNRTPYEYNQNQYPPLPASQANRPPVATNLMTKIDEILISMKSITDSLEKISIKQNEFEQFMLAKNQHDDFVLKKIDQLFEKNTKTKEVATNNENMIKNLILPTIDLLAKFLYHKNMSTNGVDDADFKYQIQTKRAMIDKVLSGRNISI
jgi:hypothetical protein